MDRRWDVAEYTWNWWPPHVSHNDQWDENFIHCYTKNDKNIRDELILDWFYGAMHNTSGVFENVEDYYKLYTTQARQYNNEPHTADCARPIIWSADTSKLDILIAKP